MGKDLILKRIKNGSGNTAEMGTVVRCNLRGYFVDGSGVKVEPFETLLSQQYKVGEGDAVPGIEMAVRFSRVGDILRVRFKAKFGYGEKGRPPVTTVEGKDNNSADGAATDKLVTSAIPPDTDLEYEIEVLSHLAEGQIDPIVSANHPHISSVEGNDESAHESYERHMERLLALTELLQRKEAGNRWFSYGDYSRALRAYSKATQVADRYFNGAANSGGDSNAKALQGLAVTKNMQGASAVEQAASLAEANAALAAAEREKEAQRKPVEKRDEELVSGYLSCLNNMAAAQLRQGEPGKAKEVCVRVLEVDPGNQKALLRAAKAALATHVSWNWECGDPCGCSTPVLLHR
jgi:tetratricopeptide (TPR) repeat protein